MITPFPWIPDTGAHVGRIPLIPKPLSSVFGSLSWAPGMAPWVPVFPPYPVPSTAPFYRTFSQFQFVKKVTRAKFRFNDHRSIFSTQIHHSASRRVETDKDPKANIVKFPILSFISFSASKFFSIAFFLLPRSYYHYWMEC